jgi:type II secretory pathway pseudopilin PulG
MLETLHQYSCRTERVEPPQCLMVHSLPNAPDELRHRGLRNRTSLAFVHKTGRQSSQGRPAIQSANLEANRRCALSLIEVVASTMIVGLMAVAALNSLGAATRSSESIGNRAVAAGLADELMSEIVQSPYKDPSQTPDLGRESGEPSSPRSSFDDLDDYDGWNKSPPQYRDGAAIPDRSDWRQRVQVRYVLPSDPTQELGSDQGAKRIRVIIEYRDQIVARQFAVRTDTDER